MSTRRSSIPAQRSPGNASDHDDVEMKDRPDSSESAIEDDGVDEDDSRDLLRMISDVSTYLCELEEE